MKKKKKYSFLLIVMINLSFIFSIKMTYGLSHSTIYGFVNNKEGNYLEGVTVKAYLGSTLEDTDYTNENGYYEVDLGLIWSPTSVTLKFYATSNHKDKTINTIIDRSQTKRKDATLIQFFALIVGGASETRFTTDSQLMHDVLTNFYNFKSNGDNIYMLTVGSTSNRDRTTSIENLNWAIGQISNRASNIDQVYIWITSHGWPDDSKMIFGSGNLAASDLDVELDDITSQVLYIFLGQCFSGSFISYLNDEPNRAIYTSCKYNESAYCTSDSTHSLWPWEITRALDAFDKAPNADENSDNRVSLDELFDWCYSFITNYFDQSHPEYDKQHPQRFLGSVIGSDTNDFIGDEAYIG